jgi:capsular polysaccharide biosynthesis protein
MPLRSTPARTFRSVPDDGVDVIGAPPLDVWEAIRRPSLRNALIALGRALVLAGITVGVLLARPTRYRSTALLVIDSPAQIAASADNGTIAKLTALRYKYSAIARTSSMAEPVAERTGVPLGVVLRSTQVTPYPDSLIIGVASTTADPARSQRISQALADEIQTYVEQEHDRYKIPDNQRFLFSLVEPAHPGVKVEPDRQRALYAGLVVGVVVLALGYVAVQLVTARRPTV